LEIVPDYTYRYAFVNKSSAETKINKLWKLSANVIIAKKARGFAEVKLGFDHSHGSDPTSGLERQDVNTLTLKVKI
jgi:hypothetical protein